jgi:quercetin dioxygenase-like cupin family protein
MSRQLRFGIGHIADLDQYSVIAWLAARAGRTGSLTLNHSGGILIGLPTFPSNLAREEAMKAVNRRSTLALGLTAAATPLIAWTTSGAAQAAGSDEGKELAPGVRQITHGERASVIPAYAMVKLRDIVLQPGAKTPDNMMKNDMICHMTEGELSVVQNEKKFTVKKGDVWTCAKGNTTEGTQNTSNAVAIMRIIDLMAT